MPEEGNATTAEETTQTEQTTGGETVAAETHDDTASATEQTEEQKTKAREGFETRQAKKRMQELERELEGYKRRAEEERKAKLTEDQRIREERDTLAAENEKLRRERIQSKIAAEFKLPDTLAARLIGTDEDALRADAAELAKLLPKPKVGGPTDPVRDQSGKRTITRAELAANPKKTLELKDAILRGEIQVIN